MADSLAIHDRDTLVILTGAGMLVESGVPASPPHGTWGAGFAGITQKDYDPEAVWAHHNDAGHATITALQPCPGECSRPPASRSSPTPQAFHASRSTRADPLVAPLPLAPAFARSRRPRRARAHRSAVGPAAERVATRPLVT